jgi:hypothetical protein
MAERDPALATELSPESLGADRSKGITWSELMAQDSMPAPAILTEESYTYRGSDPIPAERYTSEEFARLERERMWPYVWQFAAREEDLPDPGDFVVYENAGRSYLVSRQDDGSIRAMHNVCLHRGRKSRACTCLRPKSAAGAATSSSARRRAGRAWKSSSLHCPSTSSAGGMRNAPA